MVRVKICGITNENDALSAAGLGADALGFIFYKGSKRYIDPKEAGRIISSLPPFVSAVGVFVNQSIEEIKEYARLSGIDTVQLHGDETPVFCEEVPYKMIKAVRVKDAVNIAEVELYPVRAILFDKHSDEMYGGTGSHFDWGVLKDLEISKKIILSGGLTPENVSQAVRLVRPYGVDVSTGVEDAPGKKNHEKMRKFIEAVKDGV
ncbi:MAG: phosphoribosylanthranilate isomerase [Candidatus Dadabacteria bacterium]|nr:MAG: phosphoribosylanthranilate isomerase [Candidatus Dadabacteria bacterium]